MKNIKMMRDCSVFAIRDNVTNKLYSAMYQAGQFAETNGIFGLGDAVSNIYDVLDIVNSVSCDGKDAYTIEDIHIGKISRIGANVSRNDDVRDNIIKMTSIVEYVETEIVKLMNAIRCGAGKEYTASLSGTVCHCVENFVSYFIYLVEMVELGGKHGGVVGDMIREYIAA